MVNTKRGYSIYLEKWNPTAKKYINVCAICGSRGYSPVVENLEFKETVARDELMKVLPRMEVDEQGRCSDCARVQENSGTNN